MKRLRILKIFAAVFSVLAAALAACAQMSSLDQISRKLHDEYGLVGQWTITKMDVSKSFSGGAPAVQVSYDIGSSLAEGSFEVQSNGAIVGQGRAAYRVRVSAGTSTKVPVPFGIGGLLNALPVGAVAMLAPDEDGVRPFRVTGQANLDGETISLHAFEPGGKPLKLLVQPTADLQDIALWPPMTNVSPTDVHTEGASLVLRAAGNVGGINVSIEARKYIDVQGLLKLFEAAMASCGCGTKPASSAVPPRHHRRVTNVSLPVSSP